MDGPAAIRVRIAPRPHLADRRPERRPGVVRAVRHPELQHEHPVPEMDRHVGAPVARGLLGARVHPDGPEGHMQETGIPGLVAGEVTRRVPLVGNAGQPGPERVREPREVVRLERGPKGASPVRTRPPVPVEVSQQSPVQADPDLLVGIVQPVERVEAVPRLVRDGEVPRLEQQGLGADVVDVEPGDQGPVGQASLQFQRTDRLCPERVEQETRRAGLEPVGTELPLPQEQQHVEGIVEPRLPTPAVAVVPGADLLPVQPLELRGEHRVEVGVGVAAERGVAGIEADVVEVVKARERAGPGEHAHAGDEDEADVLGAVLDHAVKPLQTVPVGPRPRRVVERIKDGPVVLVHEDHGAPARPAVQVVEKRPQTLGGRVRAGHRIQSGRVSGQLQLRADAARDVLRAIVLPPKAQPQHRVGDGPVPAVMDGKSPEQVLPPLEEGLDRVQQQALAEPPGPGQEVMPPLVHKPPDERRLVDVIETFATDRREVLDADGKALTGHVKLFDTSRRSNSPAAARLALNFIPSKK